MNQPKFKFGDKVFMKGENHFTIIQITKGSNSFLYSSGEGADWYPQGTLSLYQEPQKKKLYAYTSQSGIDGKKVTEVEFFTDVDLEKLGHLSRAPEYDIEYAETERN